MKTSQISGRVPRAHFGRGLTALIPPLGALWEGDCGDSRPTVVGPGPGCSLNDEPTDSNHQPHQKCNKRNNKKRTSQLE